MQKLHCIKYSPQKDCQQPNQEEEGKAPNHNVYQALEGTTKPAWSFVKNLDLQAS